MGDLHERISMLCDKKGISGYKLCKNVGIQPSALTDLKMGRQASLSAKNMEKVANYFGVSVGYLLGNEQKKEPISQKANGHSQKRQLLIDLAENVPDDNVDIAYRMLKSLVEAAAESD